MESTILTNMCMIYSGTKILVQNRVGDNWTGIALPGGHVEMGEPFANAVIREVYEETGLEISEPRLCGVKDWIREDGSRYIVLLYKTDKFSGELKDSDEGHVFWTEVSALSEMKLASGMTDTFRIFLEDELSEHFCYLENGEWKYSLK